MYGKGSSEKNSNGYHKPEIKVEVQEPVEEDVKETKEEIKEEPKEEVKDEVKDVKETTPTEEIKKAEDEAKAPAS